MKVVCAPEDHKAVASAGADLAVVLFGRTDNITQASIGAAVRSMIQHRKLKPAARAWDLLSIALSVVAADTGIRRDESADGWTRQLELSVALGDPAFWSSQARLISQMLQFLTTDIWQLDFLENGYLPVPPKSPVFPEQDCVSLLSGGLDSLIGALDLTAAGNKPYLVSQVSQGDKQTQLFFASQLGNGLAHLQLNHNADCPGANERSQRARSIIFLAYAVLAATGLKSYQAGERIPLYICENGFISINPPLTRLRFGSLSTRTTHPVYLGYFQKLLDNAGLNVEIRNPYQYKTKGEMLEECADQGFLKKYAHTSTSCGRYARNGYEHCGRCLPCLIRRAAFRKWGKADRTTYVFADLAKDDKDHGRYDDVRAAAMAVAAVNAEGVARWAGPALSAEQLGDIQPYRDVVERGIKEVGRFLKFAGVK